MTDLVALVLEAWLLLQQQALVEHVHGHPLHSYQSQPHLPLHQRKEKSYLAIRVIAIIEQFFIHNQCSDLLCNWYT